MVGSITIEVLKEYWDKYYKEEPAVSTHVSEINSALETWGKIKNSIKTESDDMEAVKKIYVKPPTFKKDTAQDYKKKITQCYTNSLKFFINNGSLCICGKGMNAFSRDLIAVDISEGADKPKYIIIDNKGNETALKNNDDIHMFAKEVKDVFALSGKDIIVDNKSLDFEKKYKPEFGALKNDYFWHKVIMLNSICNDADKGIKFKIPHIKNVAEIHKLFNTIDDKYKKENKDKTTWVEKCLAIYEECNKLFFDGKEEASLEKIVRISDFLWDIKSFSNCLVSESSPNAILYGSPGTGKTYTVQKMLDLLTTDSSQYKIIQCHPGFGYEEFIEGLKPVGTNADGSIRFDIVNGVFKDLCIEAKNNPEKEYYFIADEINRSDLSAMFGETLSLLEPDYRYDKNDPNAKKNLRQTPMSKLISEKIKDDRNQKIETTKTEATKQTTTQVTTTTKPVETTTQAVTTTKPVETTTQIETTKNKQFVVEEDDSVYFGIPKNIRFIGMMNDVDKSIDSFDLALRRRFKWIRMDYDADVVSRGLKDKGIDDESISGYLDGIKALNSFISSDKNGGLGFGKAYEFGHSYFLKIAEIADDNIKPAHKKELFENYLEPLLREYIRSFKNESELDGLIKKARDKFTDADKDKEESDDSEK